MNQPKLFVGTLRLILVAILLTGCAKKASDEIDFGTIKNSVYENKYFGFKINLPSDWSVQDQEAQRRLSEMGNKMITGDDKNLKALVKAAEMKTVNLFAVFKAPLGSPVAFNPSILAAAEKVREFPGIQRGKDYLFQVKQALESSQMKMTIAKDISTQQLGGVDFDVMEGEMEIRGTTIKQNYYAAILKGYALVFTISFSDGDDKEFQKKTLETIAFAK